MANKALSQTPPQIDMALLETVLGGQPRAIRVFSPELDVLWDNTKDRVQRYPLHKSPTGDAVSVPPAGPSREVWPVQRALADDRLAEHEYEILTETGASVLDRFLVRAYPVDTGSEGRLIVEEIEKVDRGDGPEAFLEDIEIHLTRMIRQICDRMSGNKDLLPGPIRLKNPNLRPCHEVRGCESESCPAHGQKKNLRCWEINHTFCPEGPRPESSIDKLRFCAECQVLLLSCPDLHTRVAELINHLFFIIQVEYNEARSTHQMVQQAEKMAAFGELTTSIAHEIKNPLSVILARLDCLGLEIDGLSVEEVTEDINVIRNHAMRMRRVLEDFLKLARPAAPDFRRVRVKAVVLEVLSMTRKTLDKAGVRLKVDIPSHSPIVHGDSLQLQQVLLNIILNARDAMQEGGQLTVSAHRRAGKPPEVVIAVTDTGHGIPQDRLGDVFSPFYSTKTSEGGTGLGLVVCQRIMGQHQGRIEVTSHVGTGTTFMLHFPVEKDAS